jgi:hypothetical protein
LGGWWGLTNAFYVWGIFSQQNEVSTLKYFTKAIFSKKCEKTQIITLTPGFPYFVLGGRKPQPPHGGSRRRLHEASMLPAGRNGAQEENKNGNSAHGEKSLFRRKKSLHFGGTEKQLLRFTGQQTA